MTPLPAQQMSDERSVRDKDADMAQLALNLTRNKFCPAGWDAIDRWLCVVLKRAQFHEKHSLSDLECSLIECRYDLSQAVAELERLRAEREGLRKDAERYRWWREHSEYIENDESGLSGVAFSFQIPLAMIDTERALLFDAVADAALAATHADEAKGESHG